jgi:hypothetical protein
MGYPYSFMRWLQSLTFWNWNLGNHMTKLHFAITGNTLLLTTLLLATSNSMAQADFNGAWTVYRNSPVTGAIAAPTATLKLTPHAQAAYRDYRSIIDGTDYAPGNACVGYGMPDSMLSSGVYPMEIIQRPEQMLVIYESHSEIRRFPIGDVARNPSDLFPERNGHSTARWEGDRLIVETSRLKTQVDTRYPHSNQATIREVYYLDEPLEDGTRVLAAELTMHDPLWLEEPFVTTKRWQELKNYHVLTYECSEPKWLDEMEQLYEAAGLTMVQE